MGDAFSESDSSENIVPSSNFEPLSHASRILPKARKNLIPMDELSNIIIGVGNKSVQPPIDCQNSASMSYRSLLSDKESGILGNINQNRARQLDKILSPALGGRASVPVAPLKHVQLSSASCLTPKVNMHPNFSSSDSLIFTSAGATTTNTTSSRTTRSGSDLFRSDSSGFSKPLVPLGKRRSTVSTSTATDDQEASPAFSYTLSLSVLRHLSKVEKTDLVEFKIPDFTKTVTWQSRVRRMDEDAAAAVSEAAKVLADSLGDWLRELFTSGSEDSQSDYKHTPATVIARRQGILDARVSSSSSEYFFPRKTNSPMKTLEKSIQGSLEDMVLVIFLVPPKDEVDSKSLEPNSGPNGTIFDPESQVTSQSVISSDVTRRKRTTRSSALSSSDETYILLFYQIDRPCLSEYTFVLGMLVYARWYRKFFFAGRVIGNSTETRYRVLFDDNSKINVSGKNIILADLLPIGTDVYADISGRNEYEVGYLVSGHVVGTTPPSYIVKRIEDNEVFQLERKKVAILVESMKRLLSTGQVLAIDSRSDVSTTTSDAPSFISPTSSSSPSKCASPRGISSKAVTSGVSAGGSVRRKRGFTEMGRTEERAVPAKRSMRRKTAPQQQSDSSIGGSSPASHRLKLSKQQRTRSRAKGSAQRQEFKRKHSGLSHRDSQIWIVGRRVVARASRASLHFSSASHNRSRSRRALQTKSSGKRRQFSPPPESPIIPSSPTLTNEALNEQQKTSASTVPVSSRPSTESASLPKERCMHPVVSEEFRRTCRLYHIPLPHPDLFSQWYIVRTTGVNSTDLRRTHITFDNPHAKTQFSACENASFLRLLISAGGGQNMELLEADCVSSTGRLVETEGNVVSRTKHPRIALVALSAKRTVKFLQGLATLGRVPLVHPVWLLDACFLAAGREPLVATPEVASKIIALGTEPTDIPFELLRLSPRTLYELPRGIDTSTNQMVPPDSVPAWFIEPVIAFRPKTLTLLGGYTSSRIIAVVTDDSRGFGEGWLSILRHAMYTESGPPAADEAPIVIALAESVDRLNSMRSIRNTSNRDSNIVLVDQGRIPEAKVLQIESMGFTVINQEFLIQCLVHGRMLDLKYGTAWKR
ncbi:unnamed protein product [Hydatigera taeniaeformis]|uniref:53-BP1_Tudor domain-containing protein n=1 Tax=Hydatigena taeniaeformis TaxID=6205 RepID=A0A0R3X5P5_HYDTA|nr:unnamed protein product [Hydatigera taeniaeformis]